VKLLGSVLHSSGTGEWPMAILHAKGDATFTAYNAGNFFFAWVTLIKK
jgi:hypothetical protein